LSGSETLLRSRSLADYTIDTHESEFSEATGSAIISSRIFTANGTSARSVRLAYVGASWADVGSAV
jgi:hypothetical protein